LRTLEILSGGQWLHTDEWIEVRDPSDLRRTLARVPALGAAEVARAYDHAEQGFATWRHVSPFERARIMTDAARLLRERVDEISADVSAEMGKTSAEATGETGKAADFLEYYAGIAREGYGTLVHDARPETHTSFRREPLGVVLVITPWNDPLITPARKLAPCLAVGNSAILKPATDTPQAALHFARALDDAGLPAGVLNVITGRGSEISEPLLADPRLAALSFTGSNEVGRRLRVQLADSDVRFQGELGGKNATVVLADADLPASAKAVSAAAFGQAGQRCTATSRVIVQRAVYEEFTELLLAEAAALRLGPGSGEGTTMGPLVSARQRDDVLTHVEHAIEQGAIVLTGGDRPVDESLQHGCYVAPTVLGDIRPDMDIWRDEVFGPVIALSVVDSFADAVRAVNDSVYGLAAAVFTRDLGSAHRFADSVDCGQIAVNATTSGWDVHHPFGGFRASGSPFKEQGTPALSFYTRIKTVAIHFGA
jgi:aldehyde dehydrogenase (NAD+)